jgi:hypothetical protein
VTLNAKTRMVTLQHSGIAGVRFLDSGETDEDGYTIYREIPMEEQAVAPRKRGRGGTFMST